MQEREMTKKDKAKEKRLKKKYDDSDMKASMKKQYGDDWKNVYYATIRKKAMEDIGIKPIIKPIRGGTDGSQLSYMGLPCPNIFAGGHNFHGKYEYVPVESMQKAVEVIVRICQLTAIQ